MKILHLLASPVWSGPAEPVALLAAAQRALGHDVRVAIDRKRLLVSSEELALPHPASEVAAVVTVSLGVAWAEPTPTTDWHETLAAADQALYRAKQNGRNRVELAP